MDSKQLASMGIVAALAIGGCGSQPAENTQSTQAALCADPPCPPPPPPPETSCLVHVRECPAHPASVGIISDDYLNAANNQTECMQRAYDYQSWCGTALPVSSQFVRTTFTTTSSRTTILATNTAPAKNVVSDPCIRLYPASGSTISFGTTNRSLGVKYLTSNCNHIGATAFYLDNLPFLNHHPHLGSNYVVTTPVAAGVHTFTVYYSPSPGVAHSYSAQVTVQ